MSVVCTGFGLLYCGRPLAAILIGLGPTVVLVTAMVIGAFNPEYLVAIIMTAVVLAVLLWPAQIIWAALVARRAAPTYRASWYNRFWVYAGFFLVVSGVNRVLTQGLRQRLLEPFNIPSASMAPALLPGDQLFVVKLGPDAKVRPGDIVIYPEAEPDSGGGGAFAGSMTQMFNDAQTKSAFAPRTFISRLIAIGNVAVEGSGHEVLVNGDALKQRACDTPVYVYSEPMPGDREDRSVQAACFIETGASGKEYSVIFNPGDDAWRRAFGPTTLEAQQAFVMGDNRDNSMDSRFSGPINHENIMGRAVVIWFSFSWPEGVRWNRIGMRL